MNWSCVVIARRKRCGVDEALVQWEACWVEADVKHACRIVEVLMRRVVSGRRQMLVQWACEWIPVADCDAGALEEFTGEVIVDDLALAVDQTLVSVLPVKRRRVRNRGW
jgi:hypothetical protein